MKIINYLTLYRTFQMPDFNRIKFNGFIGLIFTFAFLAGLSCALLMPQAVSASDIMNVGVAIDKDDIGNNANLAKGGLVFNCGGLNVRSGPGTDHSIIGGLGPGAGVSIVGKEGKWYKIKYNGSTAYVHGDYINTSGSSSTTEERINGAGTVQVSTCLNVRTEPWGDIIGKLYDGANVNIVSKIGDWYKINYNGRTAYIHSNYVTRGGSASASSSKAAHLDNTPSGGASTSNIVRCAEKYIGSTRFRGPEVNYGNLACAQFVSTALKDSGALSRVQLGVLGVVADLKSRGWREVSAPPFKPGDVVTWKTYDRTGDGVKDNDTHIGIMGNDGQAISNSSSQKMPRRHSVYYAPICRVLRHA